MTSHFASYGRLRMRKSEVNFKIHFLEAKHLLFYETAINRLTPKDSYMGRTAPLTSKRCILYICSTNIGTEYFKHAL